MPRKLSRRVSFIVVIAVACTACELWLRLEYGLGNPPLVYRDNSYRYAFVPNQSTVRFGHLIKYNREGLRSEELDDRPRVLCLGDSVTNGGSPTDQSNTFPYLPESALRLDGKNVQFLNASSGGWGPAEEYAFLSRWGIYGSRAVVIEIGTNDFYQEAADAAVGTDPNFPDRKPVFAIQELVVSYLLPRVQALFSESSKNDAPVLARDRLDSNMKIIEAMIQYAKGRGLLCSYSGFRIGQI